MSNNKESRQFMKLNAIHKQKLTISIITAAAVCAIVVAVYLAVSSGAWLSDTQEGELDAEYSNFVISAQIKFGTSDAVQDSDGLFPVNVVDTAASNYITKLRVSLDYQGESEAYLRVKVLEEWKLEQEVDGFTEITALPNSPMTGYTVPSNWYDNRKYDGYFYYKLPLDASTAVNLPLITGASGYWRDPEYMPQASGYPKLTMRMSVTAEAVQTNRWQQYWNLTDLPWQ